MRARVSSLPTPNPSKIRSSSWQSRRMDFETTRSGRTLRKYRKYRVKCMVLLRWLRASVVGSGVAYYYETTATTRTTTTYFCIFLLLRPLPLVLLYFCCNYCLSNLCSRCRLQALQPTFLNRPGAFMSSVLIAELLPGSSISGFLSFQLRGS